MLLGGGHRFQVNILLLPRKDIGLQYCHNGQILVQIKIFWVELVQTGEEGKM